MNGPEFVDKFVNLLRGNKLDVGDNSVRMPSGSSISLNLEEVNGDLKATFTGTKPIVNHYGVNFEINGLKLCIKGVRVDARMIPDRFDPFYPWEALNLS
ncbi:hypothetical protein [Gimesia fumaroli]|uniref:Uncharacterized protein n=1 Tax=Gimesia fumaroli TaxID=2527976 RepID=A0A518I8Y7_9PLAN|nr:hypothetical protein [Gimesia fumaroli]QDV49561.1 hypothetical protein Enr17x_15810 [Gimesia fumaroli]